MNKVGVQVVKMVVLDSIQTATSNTCIRTDPRRHSIITRACVKLVSTDAYIRYDWIVTFSDHSGTVPKLLRRSCQRLIGIKLFLMYRNPHYICSV